MAEKDIQPNTVRVVPLASLVEWLNEHARQTNEEADKLIVEGMSPRDLSIAEVNQLNRRLGHLAASQEILNDFKGVLIAQSAEAAGLLDPASVTRPPEITTGQTD